MEQFLLLALDTNGGWFIMCKYLASTLINFVLCVAIWPYIIIFVIFLDITIIMETILILCTSA
jgi:hypothetical protein